MHHGTILGDANKKSLSQTNVPIMHCQRCYSQASSATSEWRLDSSVEDPNSAIINVMCCVSSVEIQT